MPSREYRRPLNDSLLEWLRVRFTTDGGKVTAFTAQYETIIDDEPVPVVRYDTAHSFSHLDILDRRGRVVDKVRLEDQPTLGIALTYARQDIADTWPVFREAFFEDER